MAGGEQSPEEVAGFLAAHHGCPVEGIEPLSGGFWSAAYGYRCGGEELVVRFGSRREGYEMDRAAMAFARPDAGGGQSTWRGWILDGLIDDPRARVRGWRRTLSEDPPVERLFQACSARVHEVLDACPERRDLVHGDLLHQNVLVAEDLSEVTTVFSWKCSILGDFLFDVACCTFWGPWHPGVAELDVWRRTRDADDVGSADLADAAARHHCYELQIGATHLGWNAWTGDHDELRVLAAHLSEVLDRGPLPGPQPSSGETDAAIASLRDAMAEGPG